MRCDLLLTTLLVLLATVSGCSSSHGVRTLGAAEAPAVVVRFRPEGVTPLGAAYVLVETDTGLAMLEQVEDGPAVLYTNYWKTAEDHHFAAWHDGGHAVEFIVPEDLTFPGHRYVYPNGAYRIETIDKQERPVPIGEESPVTMLVPLTDENAADANESATPLGPELIDLSEDQ